MLIKTLLNRLERFKSFVFSSVTFQVVNGSEPWRLRSWLAPIQSLNVPSVASAAKSEIRNQLDCLNMSRPRNTRNRGTPEE